MMHGQQNVKLNINLTDSKMLNHLYKKTQTTWWESCSISYSKYCRPTLFYKNHWL